MDRFEFGIARGAAPPRTVSSWFAALGGASSRQWALARGSRASAAAGTISELRPAFTKLAALTPTPNAVYGETLAAYVAAAAPRARAIYQVGHVRGDGLSDIDLIVVPGAPRFDDGQFYSARVRLPRARRLFPHDARPLPLEARDAIRYTSHSERRLVFGEDVLGDLTQASGPEQDLSLLLEGFLKYARFVELTTQEGRVAAERLVTKATSLAYSLALFDRIAGERRALAYADASLALRARLTAPGARPDFVLGEVWDLFATRFAELERELGERLPRVGGESVSRFALAFLRGQRAVAALDPARLAERRAAIARYHAALTRGGFYMGSLFAKGAYGASAGAARERRASLPRRALGKALAASYRLRALRAASPARARG